MIFEEKLLYYFKNYLCKFFVFCRKFVFFYKRIKGKFNDEWCISILDINDYENRLNEYEKWNILEKYIFVMDLFKELCDEIIKYEDYFLLLCKLFFKKVDYKRVGIRFFKEFIMVLVEEIRVIRENNKKIYCVFGFFIIFNNDFCVESLIENDLLENKFKKVLKGCGLEKMVFFEIGDIFELFMGFFIKKIDNSY